MKNIVNKIKFLNQLYQVYRIFIPKKKVEPTKFELFEKDIIAVFNNKPILLNGFYEMHNAEFDLFINLRNFNHSDFDVYKHVFIGKEYKIIPEILKINSNSLSSKKLILVDAGANIGFTSMFFARMFNDIDFYLIEPSLSNCEILLRNLKKNNLNGVLYNKALTGLENKRFVLNKNFRDGKDHAFATDENKNGDIFGVTINEIIREHALDYISILKIDIEGAEQFVFDIDIDVSFLNLTFIVAIEIHDEFQIRNRIYNILVEHGFILVNYGELTIGINKKFLLNEISYQILTTD